MQTLEPAVAIVTIFVALLGAAGSFFGVKFGLREARHDVEETQRLVRALHGRFDTLAADFARIQVEHGRLDERVKHTEREIRDQRLRARAARAGLPEPIDDPATSGA